MKHFNNIELWKSAPKYWKKVNYCDWLEGKYPEIPAIWFGDDLTDLSQHRYIKEGDIYCLAKI